MTCTLGWFIGRGDPPGSSVAVTAHGNWLLGGGINRR